MVSNAHVPVPAGPPGPNDPPPLLSVYVEHQRAVEDVDQRPPVEWCTYRGDARGILDVERNPVAARLGTARGPRVDPLHPEGIEWLWPVVATYVPGTDRTRVGWSYVMPDDVARSLAVSMGLSAHG